MINANFLVSKAIRTMKSTIFFVIASLFTLVVANPRPQTGDSSCTGKWCYNRRLGTEQACCIGSICPDSLAQIQYCT